MNMCLSLMSVAAAIVELTIIIRKSIEIVHIFKHQQR